MKVKIYQGICAVLLILVVFTYFNLKNERDIHSTNIKAKNELIHKYKDDLDRITLEKSTQIIKNRDLKHLNDSLTTAIKHIKPKIIVEIREKIVYKDSIVIRWKNNTDSIPESFSWKNKYAFLEGNRIKNGISISKFGFNDHITLVQGTKQRWFLGKKTEVVRVVHSNPYVQNSNIEPFVIKNNKKLYEKWYFWTGVGFLGGLFLCK